MDGNLYILRNIKIHCSTLKFLPACTNITVAVDFPFPADNNDISWQACNYLRELLRDPRTDRSIQFTLFADADDSSRVRFKLDGYFVTLLIKAADWGSNVEVKLTNFCTHTSTQFGRGLKQYLDTDVTATYIGTVYDSRERNGVNTRLLTGRFDKFPPELISSNFSAELTVRLFGDISGLFQINVANTANHSFDSVTFTKRLLHERIQTDLEIVTAEGLKIRCHRIFLTGNSPVFERMLHDKAFVEGQTNSIWLATMGESGVYALLAYLYYGEVRSALDNFDICLELLESSEQYGMETLQRRMKNILLDKPISWFTVEGSIRLFCFARNIDRCSDIKKLAARVIQQKNAELKESECFQKLFKENPEASMDLFFSITKSVVRTTLLQDI